MAPTHKIAIIQLVSKPGDIESNYSRAAEYIRSAASQGAELAVLPEYHLASWVPEDPSFLEQASQWKEYLRRYCDLARECNISIVPGTMLELAGKEDVDDQDEHKALVYNVAYFIDNKGTVLGHYRKRNLWHPERAHLTSSGYSPHRVIQTPLGPVGLLICWDLAFPEAFRELISQGAKLIIIPSWWLDNDASPAGQARNPSSEAVFINSALSSRAFENTSAIIYVNVGGPASQGFVGLSQVTVPFIGPLYRMDTPDEAMKIVDIDMAILDEAEDAYKIRADVLSEEWHYNYARGAGKGTL